MAGVQRICERSVIGSAKIAVRRLALPGAGCWLLLALFGASSLGHAAAPAEAAFPSKPIRIIVPFAPGGGTDFVARLIGQKLTDSMGQAVVIDNRAGASGTIGTDLVAKAAPDGYTLGAISAEQIIVSTVRKMPYDLNRDFSPVVQSTTQFYTLVVHPAVAATSVKELIGAIQAAGGRFNFGTSPWSGGHLAGELFKQRTDVPMTHIAFKGSGPAVTALLGGEISLMFATAPPVVPLIKAGRIRALAITATKRSPLMPELPTMMEAGVADFEATGWNGFLVAAKTPKAIVAKLNRELVRALALPDVRERYTRAAIEPVGGTPEAFGLFIAQEIIKWGRVVKEANLKSDE